MSAGHKEGLPQPRPKGREGWRGARFLVAHARELRRRVALLLLRARGELVARLRERRLAPQLLRVPPLHLELEPLAVARLLPVPVVVVSG